MLPLLLAALLAPASAAEAPKTYGAPLTLEKPVTVADALAKPEAYAGREILLAGAVAKACRAKGCWLALTDGKREVRVTFKDYGFFVPKDSAGLSARAQGVLKREVMSVKDARHYAKDEGLPAAEIRKIVKPVETISFVASGVELKKG